jgi:hypothetical protein
MKEDGRDLLGQFRRLAPHRRPVSLQRWSLSRLALAGGLVVAAVLLTMFTIDLFTPTHDLALDDAPRCDTGDLTVLMAQAVPEATRVPCIGALPVGWSPGGADIERGRGRFRLETEGSGQHAMVVVTLRPAGACDVRDAAPVPSDEAGTERYERPRQVEPAVRTTRYYLFAGGCVTYDIDLAAGDDPDLVFAAESALGFIPRTELAADVHRDTGLTLCGAGEHCTGG